MKFIVSKVAFQAKEVIMDDEMIKHRSLTEYLNNFICTSMFILYSIHQHKII